MAVSIDTVYQRVQALVNKEQRGYVTPTEFNLFANKAQMDIFEQYFYDLHQFKRRPGSRKKYNDPIEIIQTKLNPFKKDTGVLTSGDSLTSTTDMYMLSDVFLSFSNDEEFRAVTKIDMCDLAIIRNTPLTRPTQNRPIYYINENTINFLPETITGGTYNAYYIKTPVAAQWNGYNIGGAFAYNATNSTDFELHESEQTNLVNNILKLVGISLKDPSLFQAGQLEETKDINQEKQ
tara:strand:- start:2090 stop:2794 length:705 start_codon:yes stop_codon:yes gene_type:complete